MVSFSKLRIFSSDKCVSFNPLWIFSQYGCEFFNPLWIFSRESLIGFHFELLHECVANSRGLNEFQCVSLLCHDWAEVLSYLT